MSRQFSGAAAAPAANAGAQIQSFAGMGADVGRTLGPSRGEGPEPRQLA